MPEAAVGTGQLDYLKRLAQRLDRSSEGNAIRAVGVFSTNMEDKLTLIEAFRQALPDVAIFTFDLDARYAARENLHVTRNLLVASASGLEPEAAAGDRDPTRIPAEIPPMRDSYQVAVLAAVESVLEGRPATSVRSRTCRIFEIGAAGAVDLEGARRRNRERFSWPEALSITAAVTLPLIAARLILGCFPTETDIGSRRRMRRLRRWWLLGGMTVLGATLALILLILLPDHPEPFAWLSGTSVWPTEILQLVVAACALLGMCWLGLQLAAHDARARAIYRLADDDDDPDGAAAGAGGSSSAARAAAPVAVRWLAPLRRVRQAAAQAVIDVLAPVRYAGEPLPTLDRRFRERHPALWRWAGLGDLHLGGWLVDADHGGPRITVARLWQDVRFGAGRVKRANRRVYLTALLVSAMLAVIAAGEQCFHTPMRIVPEFDHLVTLLSWIAIAAFTVNCLVELYSCQRFIAALTVADSRWPAAVTRQTVADGVPAELVPHLLDVRFIADRTAIVDRFIILPFALLAVVVLAHSTAFDRWGWSPWAMALYGGLFLVVIGVALLVRSRAQSARRTALDKLAAERLRLIRGRGGQTDPAVESVIAEVRGLDRGAFSPLYEHPILVAISLPLSAAGLTSALSLLGVAH